MRSRHPDGRQLAGKCLVWHKVLLLITQWKEKLNYVVVHLKLFFFLILMREKYKQTPNNNSTIEKLLFASQETSEVLKATILKLTVQQ
ncbi:CLUMA_CG015642, isoform A [Clunio marinus]|uniref:CLUMA_CG015642, isoform A n=1 Tax=Clunio marinus TaxID=568069 RepID=A0A1J1ITK1_9DIPT|nr:CLUMA_CG015642, isoform A [Clunio marinus]